MTKILMTVYGITAEQAAARLQAAQFVLTAAVAAVFVWLDSNGALDGVGRWIGRTLREVLAAYHHHERPHHHGALLSGAGKLADSAEPEEVSVVFHKGRKTR